MAVKNSDMLEEYQSAILGDLMLYFTVNEIYC